MQILATLCYIRDGERTLMLHRIKKQNDMHAGKWNGLGGKLEAGESPEECAVREVYEESGLRVRDPQLRGVITFPQFDGANDWYVFMFKFHDFEGELIESPEGELAWLTQTEIDSVPLWDGDRIFMPWLDKDQFFSAKFDYLDGVLKHWEVHWYQELQD